MENQKMGFAEKLREAMEQNQEKQDTLHSLMGLLVRNWDDAMLQLVSTKTSMAECFTELETREKRLKMAQESARRDLEESNSRRVEAEEMLKKLETRATEITAKEGSLQMKENELAERGSFLNRKEDELSLEEDALDCRRETLKSEGEKLEKRANDLDSKEKGLEKRANDLDSIKENLSCKRKRLEEKEDDLDSRGESLDEKETDLLALQKNLQAHKTVLDTLQERLDRKGDELESVIVSREKEVALKERHLEKLEQQLEDRRVKMVNLGTQLASLRRFTFQCDEEQRPVCLNQSTGSSGANGEEVSQMDKQEIKIHDYGEQI